MCSYFSTVSEQKTCNILWLPQGGKGTSLSKVLPDGCFQNLMILTKYLKLRTPTGCRIYGANIRSYGGRATIEG
jgi:hypothetical protein